MNAARPTPRLQRGMTLVEVLMGALIVGLVLVAASWAISTSSTNKHIHEESPINAALLAREIHELALTLPTEASGAGPAESGADVVALDTLDGAEFSPPIDSFKADVGSAKGWTQIVNISVFALNDLENPVSDSFTSETQTSAALYRLSVQVMNGSLDMGTWWWWISP